MSVNDIKTGTAAVYCWFGWFVGYAPADKPQYVAANLDCTFWRRSGMYIVRDALVQFYNARQRW